jgi:ribosome-binding protein aMBF1 (putative translation factor)
LSILDDLATEFMLLNEDLLNQEKLVEQTERLARRNAVLEKKPRPERVKGKPERAIALKFKDDYMERIMAANNWSADELAAKLDKAKESQND